MRVGIYLQKYEHKKEFGFSRKQTPKRCYIVLSAMEQIVQNHSNCQYSVYNVMHKTLLMIEVKIVG